MSDHENQHRTGRIWDRLPTLAAVAVGAFLVYRFLLPQPSAPLEALERGAVAAPGPVRVVEIAATHCPSCLAMSPIVEQLRRDYEGRATVRVLYLDKAEDRQEATRLASLAQVRYTPTFLIVDHQGHATSKFIGPTSYAALSSAVDKAIASSPPVAAPAVGGD
ncbi:MAG: TlpA family protein disulfide reductase [Candidatus Sericytochromatia bacterium]